MIRGGGLATKSMSYLRRHLSKEARRKRKAARASRTNDVSARNSSTDATGWLPAFDEGQEMIAHVLFDQKIVERLRKAWEKSKIDNNKDDQDADDSKEEESTDGNETPKDTDEVREAEAGEESDESDDEEETEEDEEEQDDDATGGEGDLETSIAKVFMRGNLHVVEVEKAGPLPKGTQRIEDCYGQICFDDMLHLDPNANPIAIIADNSRDGVYRKKLKPLTPARLRTVLGEPRYEKTSGEVSKRRPDVDQRRLCISDPTPEVAAVLMEMCSSIDAEILPELFYSHLSRKPGVGVSISSRSVKTFTFRLSLPFYTISKMGLGSDSSERHTLFIQDMGELNIGHITVVLAGVDEGRWTAIALIDGSNGNAATVHDSEEPPSKKVRKDPITGTFLPPSTSLNARLYFPWLWKAWIEKVRDHWADVVGLISDSIKKKDEQDVALMKIDGPDVIDPLGKSIATAALWDLQLNPLHTELSGIMAAWKEFGRSGRKYFHGISIPSGDVFATRDSFPGIEDAYVELETLLKQLGDLLASLRRPQLNIVRDSRMRDQQRREARDAAAEQKKLMETTAKEQNEITLTAAREQNEITLRAAREQNKITLAAAREQNKITKIVAKSQEDMAKSAWKATITTMALLPFMLVFTLFSMEKSMIPVPTSFQMLGYTLLGFIIVMIIFFAWLDVLLRALAYLFHTAFDSFLRLMGLATKPPPREPDVLDDLTDHEQFGINV